MPLPAYPTKIISGGQTGVDRAALDVAIAMGIPHGGWCPRGRLAEDGVIPPQYQLAEHASPSYDDRTPQNVADSDGTLILCDHGTADDLRGGTMLTCDEARRRRKPCLVIRLGGVLSESPLTPALSPQGEGATNSEPKSTLPAPGWLSTASRF